MFGLLLDRIAGSNKNSPIDHTGDIFSFSDVGSGAGAFDAPPRPLVCYSSDITDLQWLFPNGSAVGMQGSGNAGNNQMFFRAIDYLGIALYRGTNYNAPDGEHCCVRTGTTQRRCITLSEYYCFLLIIPSSLSPPVTAPCPTLDTPTNGRITYNPVTNVATYDCDTGYNPTGNGQINCQSNGTNVGSWTGSVTCTSEFLQC